MRKQEIQNKINSLEEQIYYMEMANFINWEVYNRKEKELQELKKLVQ